MSVVESVEELREFPHGTVVVTADGILYVKSHRGWSGDAGKRIPSSWLLDPDHSRPPIKVLSVCARCGVAS